MANPVIQFFQQTLQNITGTGSQNQTNNQAAAATEIQRSQSEPTTQAAQNTRPTPGRGNYGRKEKDDEQNSSSSFSSSSSYSSNGQNYLQQIAKENKPTQTVTEAMRDNSADDTSEAIIETSRQTQNILQETANANKPAQTVSEAIREDLPKRTPGEIDQMEMLTTTIGIASIPLGVGAGLAAKGAAAVIPKLPAIGKEVAKTVGGFTIGGGLAGAGGPTEFSQETSRISGELKDLSGSLRTNADTPIEKIGAGVASIGLGAAGSVIDTFGALSSARQGAMNIADQIGQVPAEFAKAASDTFTTGKPPNLDGVLKPVVTFGEGVKAAGAGLIDWAEQAGNTPAYSLGEVIGFGGIFKGAKSATKIPGSAKDALIREAQADITGSFSDLAGFDRKATEKAFKAAGNTVELAQKIDVPLVSKTNVPLEKLTMFEDIDKGTLGKLEKSLANAEVVNYGTTANVLFGLDFRKTSDFDASVPGKNAVKLVNQILDDTKAYGTRPSKPITENAASFQIERPSPQTGQYAHMFDLKRLETDADLVEDFDYSTSTYPRTPTKDSQYLKIKPEGAKNAIKVEPLEFALSRKYAAVYFPRTDRLADNMGDFIAPSTISYKTKINLESYKTGLITDLEKPVTRNVPITGAGFKVARAASLPGNILTKIQTKDPYALGTISQKINYPIELGDTHRMKDALDLVGITWEYQNKLAKRGTINPLKGLNNSRKFGKNLNTMLKDDYLKAQLRTGAKDKLSDLSPEFAGFLHSKGILTDRQLSRVVSTAQGKAVETAFLSGTPNFERIALEFSPITPKSAGKGSPITPMTLPARPAAPVMVTPSPIVKPTPTPKPGNPKPPKLTPGKTETKSNSRYPFDTTPKSRPKPGPTIGRPSSSSKSSPVFTQYYPGDDFMKFGSGKEDKRRREDDKDRLDKEFGTFRAIKTQRIDHFGIYDPLEFLGKGSMTRRETRKGKALSEVTTFKKTIYEVNGNYQTRKPTGRSRR